MCELEHYDIAVKQTANGFELIAKLNIGGIKHVEKRLPIDGGEVALEIAASSEYYELRANGTTLARGMSKYLSSEVSNGFTGVVLAMYAVDGTAEFSEFEYVY